MLLKVRRISLKESYGDWADHLIALPGFDIAPFTVEVTSEAYTYPFSDPFDAVITATAKIMDLALITRDQDITDSELVDIHW